MVLWIEEARKILRRSDLDGWLLYDYNGNNPLARKVLGITRSNYRLFYFIPHREDCDPVKIVHHLDERVLSHLPGERLIYSSWKELEEHLAEVLKDSSSVLMEYSARAAIPSISYVDAGTVELVREHDVEVISSARFMQPIYATLSERQLESFKEAVSFVEECIAKAWRFIEKRFAEGVTDVEVQDYVLKLYNEKGFETECVPKCVIGAAAADPYAEPCRAAPIRVRAGDLITLDFLAKKRGEGTIYADLAWMGVAAKRPNEQQQELFDLLRSAQREGFDMITQRYEQEESVSGFEVDEVVKAVIHEAGYGEFFTIPSGHSLYETPQGPGANLDSVTALDTRPLERGALFTLEPGIYIPGELGARLEYNIYIPHEGTPVVYGGPQEELMTFS